MAHDLVNTLKNDRSVVGPVEAHGAKRWRVRRGVAWREIAGIRVILAHGYFHIDQDVVGSVIDRDVPELRTQLQQIADSLASSEGDSPASTSLSVLARCGAD